MSEFDIDELVSQMTMEEKVKLLGGKDNWHTWDVERLNIPSIRVSDGPNGVIGTKMVGSVPSGCFPCGTALAATFDKKLLEEVGALMAQEAKAKGAHVILGPTVNMIRSPLGGRGFECFSEDPVVSGLVASAIINGTQKNGISCTLKHFICNDFEDDRNSVSAIVTERALRELYLLPFQIAIRDSQPNSIMTSYNKVNGEHASQSKRLLTDILKVEWGWEGSIMSDWNGCYSIKESIESGLDLEMPGPPRMRHINSVTHAVSTREVHKRALDERVKGILKLVKFGIENSGLPLTDLPEGETNNTPETAAALRKYSQESIVLLKNDNNILPLKKDENIAVIGYNAKSAAYCGGGSASLVPYYAVTPYQGIVSKLDKEPAFSRGISVSRLLPPIADDLVREDGSRGYTAKVYDLPVGSEDRKLLESSEWSSPKILLWDTTYGITSGKWYMELEGDLVPEETGSYEFGLAVCGSGLMYIDDQLVIDNKTSQVPIAPGSILTREEKGVINLNKGQKYRIRWEIGSAPTSSFPLTTPFTGAIVLFGYQKQFDPEIEFKRACEIAKDADKVVLCVGTTQEFEAEGSDRIDFGLPGYGNTLVEEILKVQPNLVVVNQSGTPIEMPWYKEVPAIVQAWFGGNEGGNAIADVLFGDVNPSGKLAATFPLKIEDTPAFLNFKANNGEVLYGEDIYIGYKYYDKVDRNVMFPFGYGLSYTSFEISDLVVTKEKDVLKISVKVTNTGKVDGAEVVQVYVSPKSPSIARPKKELRDFAKVFVKAGESEVVELVSSVKYATSFYDVYEDSWCCEAGDYEVLVGTSSADLPLTSSITVPGTSYWKGI